MRLESPADFDYSSSGVFSPDARIPSHRSVLNVHKFKKLKRGPINLEKSQFGEREKSPNYF